MLKATKDAAVALFRVDPTITPAQMQGAIDALEGNTGAAWGAASPMDRVIPCKAAAELLGVSTRTLNGYARRGIIRPVRLGVAGTRAVGYSESSLREAMAGRVKQG